LFIGFERPSAIQQRAIKPIIQGRDVIAQSQSGTGKTAVFSIGILQMLETTSNETQALTLSPTRELAEQTQKVLLALGDFMNVQCHACIGGKSIGEDIRRLDYGVQVVSGTPGRVFDMIRRKNLRTRGLKMRVIDEADEMLNRGFKDQIYDIYRLIKLLFTTTIIKIETRCNFVSSFFCFKKMTQIFTSYYSSSARLCDTTSGSTRHDFQVYE